VPVPVYNGLRNSNARRAVGCEEDFVMQVVLVMFLSNGDRRSFSLARDITVVGRREDCDLRIPVGDVSRKHCRLVKDGDTVRIDDLGSSNGTFVNGQRVQESLLNPGDLVHVGPIQFVIQIDGIPFDDDIHFPPTAEQSHDPSATGLEFAAAPSETPGEEIEELSPDALEEVEPATDLMAQTVESGLEGFAMEELKEIPPLEPGEEIIDAADLEELNDESADRPARPARPPSPRGSVPPTPAAEEPVELVED